MILGSACKTPIPGLPTERSVAHSEAPKVLVFAVFLGHNPGDYESDVGKRGGANLFPHPILAVLALLPVVGLETLLLRKPLGVTLGEVVSANVISTLVGVPVAFGLVFALGAGFQVWIDKNYADLATVLLLFSIVVIPCFVLSVYMEGKYFQKRAKACRLSWSAIVRAHVYSYLLLIALDVLWIRAKIW